MNIPGLSTNNITETVNSVLTASKLPTVRPMASSVLQAISSLPSVSPSILNRATEISGLSIYPKSCLNLFENINSFGINSNIFGKNDTAYSRQNELETKLSKLAAELREKYKEIEQLEQNDENKNKKIDELTEKLKEFEVNKLLSHLLPRVNEYAQKRLCEDSKFAERFKLNSICKSVVVSIDIRDSTQLMLNAKSPELFAQFITNISLKFVEIVTSNYGVYDKFTGDGLLCFFPDFYSGEDAIYYALKTAAEAHQLFQIEYSKYYNSFTVVRSDVGLGIGIDYGETCLTSISNDLTVVGIPVVYACRLSSAPANHTYLNQSAFEVISEKYSFFFTKKIQTHAFKNQGSMIAYDIDLNFDAIKPELPDWLEEKDLTPAST